MNIETTSKGFRCHIKRNGVRKSRTFPERDAAELWGQVMEERLAAKTVLDMPASDRPLGAMYPRRVLRAIAGLPVQPSEIVRTALPAVELSGVYFLMRDAEVVYVGQSKNVYARIAKHFRVKEIAFDAYNVVPCQTDRLDELESAYIAALMPRFNMSFGRTRYPSASALADKLD